MLIKIYDNGGESIDRYTIIIGSEAFGMGSMPLSPAGFNQYIGSAEKLHLGNLGRRVAMENLPPEVQRAIKMRAGLEA